MDILSGGYKCDAGFNKYSSPFIIVFVSSCSFLAIATKYALRKKIHSALYHGAYFDQVLLIGYNQVAENFIDTVHKYYYYGYQCAGYIAEQPSIQNEVQYFGQFDHRIKPTLLIA